jgi:type VI protein secretion system component VasK
MRSFPHAFSALALVVALGACTTLSDQDRALLTAASQNAEAAKQQSAQAAQTAQQALAASQAAQASAAQAASDAKSANEKADRMFQRGLRK